MKIIFCPLLIFASSLTFCVGQSNSPASSTNNTNVNNNNLGDSNNGNGNSGNNIQGLNNLNQNGNATFFRPCPSLDVYCVRRYFAEHAECHPTRGPVPDPYYRPQANFFYAAFNISTVQTGIYYRGLTGTIEEFFINRESDQAVLEIRFRNMMANSTVDYYRFHRVAKEPAITKSYSSAFYPSIATTTVFRGAKRLDLKTSETFSFIDVAPTIYVDPSAGVHPDPAVPRMFAAFMANLPLALQEAQLTDSSFFAATFIQYVLCDYGLKLL